VLRDGNGTFARNLVSNELRLQDRVLNLELTNGASLPSAISSLLGMDTSTPPPGEVLLIHIARGIKKHVASRYGIRPVKIIVDLHLVTDEDTRARALVDVQHLKDHATNSIVVIVAVGNASVNATRRLDVMVAK